MEFPPELATVLDDEGRVKIWAAKQEIKQAILDYLATKFEFGREYTEPEVNELLRQWHTFEDWALLRREMFEKGLLNRAKNGATYWRTPKTKMY
jgi:hypothetical protein